MPGHHLLIGIDNPRLAASLRGWLLRDTGLRGRIDVYVQTASGDDAADNGDGDALADPTAIVAVALSTLMTLPAFVASVRGWFGGRPPTTPPIVLRHGETSVQISGDTDPAAVASLAAALATALTASEQLAAPPQQHEEPTDPAPDHRDPPGA